MIRPGQVLTHPMFGTRLTFLQTGTETGGRLLEWETLYKAHRGKESGNIPHFHASFVEQCEVLEGTAAYEFKGEERQALAPARVEIPIGVVHRNLWNTSADEMRFLTHIEMDPPNLRALLFIETSFETLYGLARDGRLGADGLPKSYLHTALMAQGFQPDTWTAGSPIPIQRVLIGTVAAFARLRGYRTQYKQYDAAT